MKTVRVLTPELAKEIDRKFQKAKATLAQLEAITAGYNENVPHSERLSMLEMNEILGGYEVIE